MEVGVELIGRAHTIFHKIFLEWMTILSQPLCGGRSSSSVVVVVVVVVALEPGRVGGVGVGVGGRSRRRAGRRCGSSSSLLLRSGSW